MNDHIKAEVAQLHPLVGGTILRAIHDPGGEGGFGFQVRTAAGTTHNVWVDCDPEGNGPGHLNIEPAN